MKVSVKKEKAIVFVGSIMGVLTGYLTGVGRTMEAGIIGSITAAVLVFWSEGINTEEV